MSDMQNETLSGSNRRVDAILTILQDLPAGAKLRQLHLAVERIEYESRSRTEYLEDQIKKYTAKFDSGQKGWAVFEGNDNRDIALVTEEVAKAHVAQLNKYSPVIKYSAHRVSVIDLDEEPVIEMPKRPLFE